MQCNTLESTIPFPPFLQWTCGKRGIALCEIWIQWQGSQGVIRKECVAQQCGHWGCCAAGPEGTSTAHSSSASFGPATCLLFKWTTAHSCGHITLTHFSPESVSTEAIEGLHYISAATKARHYLQKCISVLTPADML